MGWLLVALTMFASPVWAQTTSNILGTAEDANGAPVAGIKVVLGGEALIGGARETLTATDGSFRFIGLLPGGYTVTATAEGFRPFASGAVYLSLGETMDLTALMEVKTSEDVITTTAPAPVVDTKKVTMGQTLSRAELKNLPLPRRSYQQATRFVAGVDPDAGGGNPSIHGSSTYSNAYLVDGVNTTDPSVNTFSLNFNYDAICDIEVQTGTISPEYGNVTGGVINLVTCGGSNEHHFDTSYYFSSKELTMEDRSGAKRDASEQTFNVNAGGPIIQDRLWYYTSLQYLQSQSQIAQLPERTEDHNPEKSERLYWLAKLTGAPDTHNRFTLLFQGDPSYLDNTLQDPTVANVAEEHQDQGGMLASLRWDGLYDPYVAKVQLAYKSSFIDVFPQARAKSSSPFNFGNSLSEKNDFGLTSGCLVGPDGLNYCGATASDVQDSSQFGNGLHYNLDTGERTVGDSADYYTLRERYQGTASVSRFFDSSFGKHEVKTGIDSALMRDTVTERYAGGASVFYESDKDGDGSGDPDYASIVSSNNGTLTQVVEGTVIALFALDNWDIADRIRLQPGVRVEKSRYDNYEGETVLDFDTVAPRFGFSADAFGDKQTRIHGGYGQLYETGNLYLAQFVGTSLQTHDAYWQGEISDDNDNGKLDGSYVEDPDNQSIEGGASGRRVDKNLQPMRTDEYQVGIEQALSEDASVDLTYIRRGTVNAWEDRGVGQIWNQAGTVVVGSEDGSFSQVLEVATIDGAERNYEAFELSLNKQFANSWSMAGSYTLSWLEGSTVELISDSFDNPRQNSYGYGPLADDHRHVIKMQGAYLFPVGLSVGATYEFASGAPYSKLFLNDSDGGYSNRRSPRGTDPGIDPNDPSDDQALTLPDYTNISLHAGYSLQMLTGQDLELVANINNLLNLQAVTGIENNNVKEGYGLPNAYQSPFTAQLGVTYSY